MKSHYLLLIYIFSIFSITNCYLLSDFFDNKFSDTYQSYNTQNDTLTFDNMLSLWSESYLRKVQPDYQDTINFQLRDNNQYYYIVFNNRSFKIFKERNYNSKITVIADFKTYSKIFNGELSPQTAAGRSSMRKPAPLDFKLENGMTYQKIDWERAYLILINFFNHHPHNKIVIKKEYSREIHSGNAIGLYYSKGYRSAYYFIDKADTLNKNGESDPYEQSIIIVKGTGFAKIGSDTLVINENEAYHIRPNIEHKIWTNSNDGISLLWSAWGEKVW